MYTREQTRRVKIGNLTIGGGNPVRIQSMTNTKTKDVSATVEQILKLEKAGCEIIRATVPDMESAQAFEKIKEQIRDNRDVSRNTNQTAEELYRGWNE